MVLHITDERGRILERLDFDDAMAKALEAGAEAAGQGIPELVGTAIAESLDRLGVHVAPGLDRPASAAIPVPAVESILRVADRVRGLASAQDAFSSLLTDRLEVIAHGGAEPDDSEICRIVALNPAVSLRGSLEELELASMSLRNACHTGAGLPQGQGGAK